MDLERALDLRGVDEAQHAGNARVVHVLVQDVVVLDVGAHRQRRGELAAVEEDRGAGDAHVRGLW